MGIFGKIVAFLNVILGITVLGLLVMDWTKRQQWAAAYLRHQLALEGLPLDENDDAWARPGEPIYPQLSDALLKETFAKSPGGDEFGGKPVRTQDAEVKRIRDLIVKKIQEAATAAPPEMGEGGEEPKPDAKPKAGAEDGQRLLLLRFLLPQAATPPERDALMARINPFWPGHDKEKDTVEELTKDLVARFDRALEPLPKTDDSAEGKRDRTDKRLAIARLFVGLDTRPPGGNADDQKKADIDWHTRVQTIVGIDMYQRAISVDAAQMSAIALAARQAIVADQLSFKRQYDDAIRVLPGEARKVVELGIVKADLEKTNAQHDVIVKARREEVMKFEADLDTARKDTRVEFAKLAFLEKQLFEIQQKLGAAQEKNIALEKELRRLELDGR